jgi:hypothetical protein
MLEVCSLESYQENILGGKKAIPKLLQLFERYHIHATWATVGFLFADNFEQLQQAYDEADAAYKALEKKARNLVKDQTNNRAALTQLKDALRDYETKLQAEKLVAEYREKLATLPTNKITKATIVVDGQYDKDALDRCTPLTLTMADCLEWKQAEEDGLRESDGAGLAKGEEVAAKGDTTEVNFYVLYDDEYLYIVEWRWDANWSFTASDHTQSYTGDGSMLWFVNTGEAEEWLSGGSMSSDPAFGLMWNAGIGGAEPGENAPNIAFFPDDTQTSPVEKTASGAWNSAIEWDANQFSYILELAIPWTDLADCFTKEDLEAGKISATFCTVDVVNPEYPGGTEGLWDNAYQMQYPGVNYWHLCRPLVVAQ